MAHPQEFTGAGFETGPSLVRVLLVDDQQLVRAGLRSLLSDEEDIVVVGEAASADAALRVCAEKRPDLLLIDSMLPEMAAPALIREARSRYPTTQVLAIADCSEGQCTLLRGGSESGRDCLEMAARAGARGAIRKTCSPEEFRRAIRTVAPGRYWMELNTALKMIDRLQHGDRPALEQIPWEGLTQREVEVVRELIAGYSNKQIGRTLGISEQSAKNLVSRVLAKLNLESRVQVAVYAVNTRLLDRYAFLFAPGQ